MNGKAEINSIMQPDPFYDHDLHVENFYKDYCAHPSAIESACKAASPIAHKC